MKKLLGINIGNEQVSIALLIVRIGVASMMLVHGFPKMQMLFSGDASQFPGVMGLSPMISLALAVFAEVVCSVLILIGLATRFAAIPLIITMMVAVFYIHATDPFSSQELGLHYLMSYIVLLILGSGKYSLDAVLVQQNKMSLQNA
ncbi:DoxX family protein [Antarcticibacterium flavum]|uniref:DoxX family protein n=1 Tax=Antarcticibacterium flavum TaxID=2058175 RepID=A0A5B7WZM4_9FLAO|nr:MULTISPECIES: DoxX family protein [Antarcticibacterium]MCM4161238.1 DoxX family protein [Antarcticibacterium sp. W02-3]QCY68445.1 DoxX family protein [Antarcticibacterium flavum]